MIVVNLKGGLGNQMFQYACARAISLRQKAAGRLNPIKLDLRSLKNPKKGEVPRAYDLHVYAIAADIATDEDAERARNPYGFLSEGWRFFSTKILRRFNVGYVPKIAATAGDAYLDGYFQTERYFSDFAEEIRKDFALKDPLTGPALDLYEKISRDPYSVSVGIRRGDLAANAASAKQHGMMDLSYYERAVAEVARRIGKPSLYVFSDDIEWAKENLSFSCPVTFVSGPGVSYLVEPTLMSACRHNIIANSTFGWWGAWLNRNPDKIVVAPKRWAKEHEEWFTDILPPSWIRI